MQASAAGTDAGVKGEDQQQRKPESVQDGTNKDNSEKPVKTKRLLILKKIERAYGEKR